MKSRARTIYRCEDCGTFSAREWDHSCGYTTHPCAECGTVHDGFSSNSTGTDMCLKVLTYQIQNMTCRHCGQYPA